MPPGGSNPLTGQFVRLCHPLQLETGTAWAALAAPAALAAARAVRVLLAPPLVAHCSSSRSSSNSIAPPLVTATTTR